MTPQERIEYNLVFKNILISYCAGMNLNISCNQAQYNNYGIHSEDLQKTLTDKPAAASNIVFNALEFLKKYTPFKSDGTVSPILFEPSIANKIWEYADNILEEPKEKQAFFKYFKDCNESYYSNNFRQIIYNATNERFFTYLDSCIPKHTDKAFLQNFKSIFPLLKNRKYETSEQKDTLLRFAKHYKKIIKRSDTMPAFCDLIAQKITPKEHAPFAKIVGRDIVLKLETFPDDIMSAPTPSQTLPLRKDKLFERIKVTGVDISSVPVMNDIHTKLIDAFNLKTVKDKLGLIDSHFVEFLAAHNRGKITFEFTSEDHRTDMPTIYLHCLQSCARNYSRTANNYNEVVEKTISHYLLEQNLPVKNENSILTRKI